MISMNRFVDVYFIATKHRERAGKLVECLCGFWTLFLRACCRHLSKNDDLPQLLAVRPMNSPVRGL